MSFVEVITCVAGLATVVGLFRTPSVTVNNHISTEKSPREKKPRGQD
jgi:hypothetical protein